MAGQNFEFWLYDKSKVSNWYFWTPVKASWVDRLKSLWIIWEDTEQEEESTILKQFNESKSIWTKAKEVIAEPFWEIKEGLQTFWADVRRLQEWRLEDTEWLLGKFFEAWENRLEKINELNRLIDETGWSKFDKIIGTWLNVIGAWVDFSWDALVSALKTIAPQWVEDFTEEKIKQFWESEFWQQLSEFIATGWEKVEEFEQTSPEAKRLSMTLKSLLPLWEIATAWAGGKILKETWEQAIEAWRIWKTLAEQWIESWKQKLSDIEFPSLSRTESSDDTILKNLNLQTTKGIVNWQEVEVPVVDRTITERFIWTIEWKTNKELAGRAVSPRTIWKNPKQKLQSIANVEKNTKKFYENIRTGALEWDISTLENAAQTIVDNLDTVWNRIWQAVKQVDWNIQIDNDLTDKMLNALETKGAEVSPATWVLKKFYDSLWDWNLTVDEAYELKKAYSNEVTKLYKSWDAGTAQYKALSDWVQFLNEKIDNIIENDLWDQFKNDKELYRSLKLLVDDMVASALVEWRKAPESFAERIGKIESIFSPVNSVKQKLIKDADELNQRGWAWIELIRRYDEEAIKNARNN